MRKKILKVVALIVCFTILSLYVPGMLGVEKTERSQARVEFKRIFIKPAVILTYFFPFLGTIFDSGANTTSQSKNTNTTTPPKKIKITGGLNSPKGSTGD